MSHSEAPEVEVIFMAPLPALKSGAGRGSGRPTYIPAEHVCSSDKCTVRETPAPAGPCMHAYTHRQGSCMQPQQQQQQQQLAGLDFLSFMRSFTVQAS